ncbi:MAG: phosphatase PAP2 family protein [Flavobacteriaceae bacterium]|nr:phosphatase PAP2 family protein [Flavobacteriaceae bacterium]
MGKYLLVQLKYLFVTILFFGTTNIYGQLPDEGGHEQWEYILVDTGDVLQLAIPLTALTATLVEKDFEGTKQFAYSYGSAMILTHSLKYLIHKQRPEGRERYDAFPSGHTSSAFSGASFIQKRYGWKYGWPAYVLATIVGVSRMEGPDGFHDIWDVIAGASVGIGTTYLFTSPYPRNHFDIGFASGNGNYLLTMTYRF